MVALPTGNQRLLLWEIYYIEVQGHKLTYHTEKGQLPGTGTLQDAEQRLHGKGFLRCNKCYLVNQKHIQTVTGSDVVLSNGEKLQISRLRKKEFMEELARSMGNEFVAMSTVIDLFERHGYVLNCWRAWRPPPGSWSGQERFAARLSGILLAEACFTIVWEQMPHNLYTESLRTFLLWSIAAVGIRLCFRIAAAWAVFYATAAGTMQHIIYRGPSCCRMRCTTWTGSIGLEPVGLSGSFRAAVRGVLPDPDPAAHSRNLGTLPGRTMTFIMVGYQLSMNIFVNLFNAFSVDSAPRIFTVYSVYDEVTTILLFFLLCEILQHSDAEWDNMVLQQMMRQQRQQMELSKRRWSSSTSSAMTSASSCTRWAAGFRRGAGRAEKRRWDIYDSRSRPATRRWTCCWPERSIVCKGRGIQLDYIADGCKAGLPEARRGVLAVRQRAGQRHRGGDPAGAGPPLHRPAGAGRAGMLLIRMENCAAEPLHFVDGLPQTTKGDARWHGFCVKSIRRIVQQHGGTLTMQAQDGMFRLVALLPLK